jgi:membrane-associated phospholipid phosphatase
VGQPPESDDDDLLRRLLIERRYPLTWKGISSCALASIVGLALVLAKIGGLSEVLAAFLFVAGALLALKGVLRMTWLRLGGTDEPLMTYFRRRLGA